MKKSKHTDKRKWSNHVFAICALTFDICTMATGTETKIFDLIKLAKDKFSHLIFKGEDESEPIIIGKNKMEEVGYRTNCVICKKKFEMTFGELEFYKKKGFNLPKKCSECRERLTNVKYIINFKNKSISNKTQNSKKNKAKFDHNDKDKNRLTSNDDPIERDYGFKDDDYY